MSTRTPPLIDAVTVLDLTDNLAGLYAGQLMCAAGAQVHRPRDLGQHIASPGTGGHPAAEAALVAVLNDGKLAVDSDEVAGLVAGVDLVLDSRSWPAFDPDLARAQRPALTVVSLTDFGRSGPLSHRRSSSPMRQALSGSTFWRGDPDSPPVMAGGEIEQFLAAAYAAAGGLACVRHAHRHGVGDHLDLSLFEVTNLGLTTFGATLASLWGRTGEDHPDRSVQIPAIEKTADGWVGLCTISARQRQDLMLVVGRPDLADDESIAYAGADTPHAAAMKEAISSWASAMTTAEIIDIASALRIPVAPIGSGATLTDNEQLRARGFYRRSPAGHSRPAAPFSFRPADDVVAGTAVSRGPTQPSPGRPLSGLRVVDLTAWWAGPAATHLLAAMGADVVKVESGRHPDGMRYSFVHDPHSDHWWEKGPVFFALNTNKRGVTVDFGTERGLQVLTDLIAEADLLVENFTPRVIDSLPIDWTAVRQRNPRLVTVRMPAFGLDGPWRDRTGFAQTIEQSSGLAWMTGHPDGAPLSPRGVCDPLAGLHAAFVGLAAVMAADRSGVGGQVEVSMIEPAAYATIGQVLAWELDGQEPARLGNADPVHCPQDVWPARDGWVVLRVESTDEWLRLTELLQRPQWRGGDWDGPDGRRANALLINRAIAEWVAAQPSADTAARQLTAAGLQAARVVGSGRLGDDPQLRHRRFFEQVSHPIAGEHPVPGLPFRSANREGRPWNATPAPTLGQHTREVLTDWLALPPTRVEELFDTGICSAVPLNLVQPETS